MPAMRDVESAGLAGLQVRCTDGTVVRFVDPPDDSDAGVREPCRPKPPVLTGSAALEVPS